MFLRSIAWVVIITMIATRPGVASRTTIHLTDQRGTTFAFSSLRESPVVVTFVSAHCNDACPIIEAQIAQSVEQLAHSPRAIRFLTITLDPERDTRSDMQRLARIFDASPARWIFATGSRHDVHALMALFGVVTQRNRQGFATSHTSYVYVLDPRTHDVLRLLPSTNLSVELQESIQR